ncbi:MAG: hypothetical protein WD278_13870, partial [Pirellulales bacterium]
GEADVRQSVVERLRHQEQLVRSMECVYEVTFRATPAAMVPLIEELCRMPGSRPAAAFISTGDQAHRAYRAHWWRKGIKERREEERPAMQGRAFSPTEIEVFDGQAVKTLANTGNEVVGFIGNAETAAWYQSNTIQPFSLLYEFQRGPYSELIAKSPKFSSRRVMRQGVGCLEVSFTNPNWKENSFVLLFDAQWRLLERQYKSVYSGSDTPRIGEIHYFSDYKDFHDFSGERIWFPRRATYRYYLGKTNDGRLVEYDSRVIHIRDIKFNAEISDDKFTLEFPPTTRVFDQLQNLGPLAKPTASGPPVAANDPLRLLLSVLATLLLGVLVVVILSRKARAAKASHRTET